jgi:hypothetical protein
MKKQYLQKSRDIETNNITGFGKKLERKTIEEVFRKGDANYRYFPETFNFKPLYIYPDILSAIFNEAYNRDNEGEEQEIWIKQNDGYEYLVIGNVELQQELGFGGHEMMGELESRVKKLVDGETIRGLVRDYYAKQSELETNSNIMNYELERERIWISVNSEGGRIRRSCAECSEEYLQSHFLTSFSALHQGVLSAPKNICLVQRKIRSGKFSYECICTISQLELPVSCVCIL